ncbi:MAG TPA: DUF5985 family protein [Bryobacteraceae bacterium]|nr:DUF5985 family protein [Bryobacteraceae bacterium]
MTTAEAFLLGLLTAMFLTAAVFFLRFWKETRDRFFLTFAGSFFVEGVSRVALLFVDRPSQPHSIIYVIRMLASLLIVWAILQKNYGKSR